MSRFVPILCLFAAVGCSGSVSQESSPRRQSAKEPAKTDTTNSRPDASTADNPSAKPLEPVGSPSAIDVQILTWDKTQELVAAHKGHVVVLDVWSTSCQPCVREFPGLVVLSKKYPDRIACISFNVDYDGSEDNPPESYREDVLKFLTGQDARFDNVISSDPNEDFFNKINLGGPPAVFVYDRSGKLVRRFDNSVPKQPEFTYEKDVTPFVEQLLAGP